MTRSSPKYIDRQRQNRPTLTTIDAAVAVDGGGDVANHSIDNGARDSRSKIYLALAIDSRNLVARDVRPPTGRSVGRCCVASFVGATVAIVVAVGKSITFQNLIYVWFN